MSANYRRQGPRALCQNHEDLLSITEFNFDLTDPFFIGYFVSRTGIQLHERDGGVITADDWSAECAAIIEASDMPDKILRARLQDCWALYCEHNEQAEIAADSSCLAHNIACDLIAEWTGETPGCSSNVIVPFPPQPKPKHRAFPQEAESTNIIAVDFDDDSDAIRCSPNYSCPAPF
tara:strand:+ start:2038 stop:2568 length:531 start_codon:yes stop_codon:yes gene_type:complete